MIRREVTDADGRKIWLLISQVEHARISGQLMRYWREHLSEDVVRAISHHDDGWGAWEADPKLNPDIGAPYSFLEMPVPAALVIWDHSIAAVGEFGPLAAYIVAGHFYNLLSNSDNAADPLAAAWLSAKRKHRTSWLDEWIRQDPTRTLAEPKRAQEALLLADLFSLWLCCDCPTAGDEGSILGHSAMKRQTARLLDEFKLTVRKFSLDESSTTGQAARLDWTVDVLPYPFQTNPLVLAADCIAVPVAHYASWQELRAASWLVDLRWGLADGVSTNGSPD